MSDIEGPTGTSEFIHPGQNSASSLSGIPGSSLHTPLLISQSASFNVFDFPCLDYCNGLLMGLPDSRLCPPTHLPCCQGVNLTKLPTHLLFQLSRWLFQGEVAPLSTQVSSRPAVAYFFHPQSARMAHHKPVLSDSPWHHIPRCLGRLPTFPCLADTHSPLPNPQEGRADSVAALLPPAPSPFLLSMPSFLWLTLVAVFCTTCCISCW